VTAKHRTLERAAINAHRQGTTWRAFWREHVEDIRRAEPYDSQKYHRLVKRLLALVTSGDTDGMHPVGTPPWELVPGQMMLFEVE